MTQTVPLLVTVDVEIAPDHDLPQQSSILDRLRAGIAGLPITWFCTADAADEFHQPLRRLAAEGHEIGCHGLDHGPEDNFRSISLPQAQKRLGAATERVAAATGVRPRCFRGPAFTTSSNAQTALIENDYRADFSGCAQRADLFICGGARMKWLFAPRGVYQPARDNPFRRGDSPLRVVNLSSLGLPFVSGILFLGGLPLTRCLFRTFLAEARRTGRPIVYLFHSYEFTDLCDPSQLPFHQRLYLQDRERRYQRNLALLNYMREQDGVEPMTGSACLDRLDPSAVAAQNSR